ncbi:MAG: N-formylglutamate amidohydrolase [Sphingomonadales bacterium]|nr:N-formylglutamate amidohydrolase [Sphingomonadales bacterium]
MVRRPILAAVACPSSESGALPAPPFELREGAPSAIPVLIAVPHAGRAYPDDLLARLRQPAAAALRLEDRRVDAVGRAVAAATGAALVVATAPRAMIDLNRATDDVDWEMIEPAATGEGGAAIGRSVAPSRRARSGLGLVPRRLPGLGELWNRPLPAAELAHRIAAVHQPYHQAVAEVLGRLRARWGAALLIDLHSMPPLPPQGREPGAAFVIGDRFGTTCAGAFVASAFGWFAEAREVAAHNRPYAGGYVLERHAAPRDGIHALQLEIDRSRYLEPRLAELGPGFARVVNLVSGLVTRLAGEVAECGRSAAGGTWADAAE